jgi:hypothetical protein
MAPVVVVAEEEEVAVVAEVVAAEEEVAEVAEVAEVVVMTPIRVGILRATEPVLTHVAALHYVQTSRGIAGVQSGDRSDPGGAETIVPCLRRLILLWPLCYRWC